MPWFVNEKVEAKKLIAITIDTLKIRFKGSVESWYCNVHSTNAILIFK